MILFHLANVLTLVSYIVRDILWLRVLACIAGLCFLARIMILPTIPIDVLGWQIVFVVINIAQIKILLLERRPVAMTNDEQRLYQLVFRALRPREFKRLVALGTLEDRRDAEAIVKAGAALEHIMVVVDGTLAVKRDGQTIATLGAGRFVGEMSFLTGEAPAADVLCEGAARIVAWPAATLKAFLADNPDLRAAMQLIIGTDLVAKLRR